MNLSNKQTLIWRASTHPEAEEIAAFGKPKSARCILPSNFSHAGSFVATYIVLSMISNHLHLYSLSRTLDACSLAETASQAF